MSECERFAQVAHDKKANEQFAPKKFCLKNLKSYFFSMSYIRFLILKMSDLLIPSFLVSDVRKLLRSLTKNERP